MTTLSTGTAPGQAVIDAAVAAAGGKDAVVVGTYNVAAGSAQQKLVRALAATGVPVVALAIRNPYDVAHLPEADAVLATYSWTDVELRAAVRVLAAGRGRAGSCRCRCSGPTTRRRSCCRSGSGCGTDGRTERRSAARTPRFTGCGRRLPVRRTGSGQSLPPRYFWSSFSSRESRVLS
ncbi:hypothetical protein ACFQVA_12520 [Actinomadura keratinilytica]